MAETFYSLPLACPVEFGGAPLVIEDDGGVRSRWTLVEETDEEDEEVAAGTKRAAAEMRESRKRPCEVLVRETPAEFRGVDAYYELQDVMRRPDVFLATLDTARIAGDWLRAFQRCPALRQEARDVLLSCALDTLMIPPQA